MGSKRPFSEVEEEAASGRTGPADLDEQWRKRMRKIGGKKHNAREGSANWTKKRARTIERRLQRNQDDIPADKLKELERELATHKKTIGDLDGRKQRSNMIKKYHMVRFFERKKAERLNKQLRRRLAEASDQDEIVELKRDIHITEIDRLYTTYFPHLERYISLYPTAESSKATGDPKAEEQSSAAFVLHSPRPPLWVTVEEAAEKGEMYLRRLRDRRSDPGFETKLPPKGNTKTREREPKGSAVQKPSRYDDGSNKSDDTARSRRTRRRQARAEAGGSENEDGGGFFNFA